MRRMIFSLAALWLSLTSAAAMSPAQLATVTPAYQAPGWTGWAPASLGSALKARWDAGDHGTANMTDDGSGLISNWVDNIGSMAITASTTARGTWGAAAFNGSYPGIALDGTSNCYVSTTLTTLPTGANAGWIFVIADNQAVAVSARYITAYGMNAAAALRASRVSAGNVPQVYDGTTVLGYGAALTGPMMILAIWSGTTEYGFINGRPFATPSATIASLNTGTVRFRIGADLNPAGFWQGPVNLVMVGTGVPDQATIDRLFGWPADRGMAKFLPYNHPYRFRAP